MPRVYLSETERLTERFTAWVYGQMKVRKISQRVLASEMDISQPALTKKLKNRSFSFIDFLNIVRVLEPDSEELIRLINTKGG